MLLARDANVKSHLEHQTNLRYGTVIVRRSR